MVAYINVYPTFVAVLMVGYIRRMLWRCLVATLVSIPSDFRWLLYTTLLLQVIKMAAFILALQIMMGPTSNLLTIVPIIDFPQFHKLSSLQPFILILGKMTLNLLPGKQLKFVQMQWFLMFQKEVKTSIVHFVKK